MFRGFASTSLVTKGTGVENGPRNGPWLTAVDAFGLRDQSGHGASPRAPVLWWHGGPYAPPRRRGPLKPDRSPKPWRRKKQWRRRLQ